MRALIRSRIASFARRIALAAAAASVVSLPAAAGDTTASILHPLPSVGVGAGQIVQVNVAGDSSGGAPLAVVARLLGADGGELARSERRSLAPGATFTWRIRRTELGGRGDELGRVQVRAELLVSGSIGTGAFVPSLELVDERTGATSGMIGDVRTVISGEAALQPAERGFY
jgi:hypothetical protein